MRSLEIKLDELNRIDFEQSGDAYKISLWQREKFAGELIAPGFPEFSKWECLAIVSCDFAALVEAWAGLRSFLFSDLPTGTEQIKIVRDVIASPQMIAGKIWRASIPQVFQGAVNYLEIVGLEDFLMVRDSSGRTIYGDFLREHEHKRVAVVVQVLEPVEEGKE